VGVGHRPDRERLVHPSFAAPGRVGRNGRREKGRPGAQSDAQTDRGVAATTTPVRIEADPLVDIAAVLAGATKLRTQEVLQRLAERDRATYGTWTFPDLKAFLAKHDAAPRKSGGNMVVLAALIAEAIAERDEKLVDDEDENGGFE
jgi:hypothetical protein